MMRDVTTFVLIWFGFVLGIAVAVYYTNKRVDEVCKHFFSTRAEQLICKEDKPWRKNK